MVGQPIEKKPEILEKISIDSYGQRIPGKSAESNNIVSFPGKLALEKLRLEALANKSNPEPTSQNPDTTKSLSPFIRFAQNKIMSFFRKDRDDQTDAYDLIGSDVGKTK